VVSGELFGFFPEGEATLLEIGVFRKEEEPLETIDLRNMEPVARHPIVIDRFKKLAEGEAFEIVNDHDPLPLYFQMNLYFPSNELEERDDGYLLRIWKTEEEKTSKREELEINEDTNG